MALDPTRLLSAKADLKRMLLLIAVIGVVMVAVSLLYLASYGPLHVHMVVATVLGVFVSMLLGCGLFAAAFFSANSGLDEAAAESTVTPMPDDAARASAKPASTGED